MSRPRQAGAVRCSPRAGFPSFPIHLYRRDTNTGPGFPGPVRSCRGRWHAGLETLLAGVLAVSFEAGQEYDRPREPDRGLEPGLENGSTDLRSLRLVLDTGKQWMPVIEHRWDRSRSDEGIAVISATDLQVAAAEIDRESLQFSERWEHDVGLAQWFSYSRAWTRDARGLLDASGVPLPGGTESRGLLGAGQAGLSWTWEKGSVSLQVTRDRVFDAPDDPDPADGAWSYFHRLAGLFAEPGAVLRDARERTLRDVFTLDLEMPRTGHLGAAFAWEAGYTELNFDPSTGARDVSTNDELSLAMPWSPDGKGLVLLTPEVSVSFTGTYRSVASTLCEAELLLAPLPGLLLVPLTWNRGVESDAALPFVDDGDVEAATNAVAGRLALTARIAKPEWYQPSRASIALKDDTGRSDSLESQSRGVSLSLGRDASFGNGRTLTVDADGSLARNFTAGAWSFALGMRTTSELPGARRRNAVDLAVRELDAQPARPRRRAPGRPGHPVQPAHPRVRVEPGGLPGGCRHPCTAHRAHGAPGARKPREVGPDRRRVEQRAVPCNLRAPHGDRRDGIVHARHLGKSRCRHRAADGHGGEPAAARDRLRGRRHREAEVLTRRSRSAAAGAPAAACRAFQPHPAKCILRLWRCLMARIRLFLAAAFALAMVGCPLLEQQENVIAFTLDGMQYIYTASDDSSGHPVAVGLTDSGIVEYYSIRGLCHCRRSRSRRKHAAHHPLPYGKLLGRAGNAVRRGRKRVLLLSSQRA